MWQIDIFFFYNVADLNLLNLVSYNVISTRFLYMFSLQAG